MTIGAKTAWISLASLLTLSACNASFGDRVHEDVHQAFSTGATPVVHVNNVIGRVRIATWDKPSVDVKATKYASDDDYLRNITIDMHLTGNDVTIATRYTGSDQKGGVRYTITVPTNASLDIDNVAGTIDVAGVRGNVTAKSQVGTIDAKLGTVGADRTLNLDTTTGTVRLAIAGDSSARVDAHSTIGSFSTDFPTIQTSRDNLGASASGSIGAGAGKIRLTTTTGSIDLNKQS